MMILGQRVDLDWFLAAVDGVEPLDVTADFRGLLSQARATVDSAAQGPDPVYGLNTGLGANLGHRIEPEEIATFQRQLLDGRAVAVGPALPEATGRAMLLARLVSMQAGVSGVSLPLFDHLCAVYAVGLSPVVPRYGSIGAGDLTVNAVWATALLGAGRMWRAGKIVPAEEALKGAGLSPPALQPKDAMALINHGGFSAAVAAWALGQARQSLHTARSAALLSFAGYGANLDILAPRINEVRRSPGQAETAAWLLERLEGSQKSPRRIQDPLSFRTIAPVLGAALSALDHAIAVWKDEVNGASDSPAVLGGEAMASTPNFHAPALALALENLALAVAMVGNGSVQRIQKMMNPELSGLPKYLSPVGRASAGMVPLQKTAAALLADLRRHAVPLAFDAAPVSDTVEDMAPMTAQAALKLTDQTVPFDLLLGAEALVAVQAIDLRGQAAAPAVVALHQKIRAKVAMLQEDRALGPDVEQSAAILKSTVEVSVS